MLLILVIIFGSLLARSDAIQSVIDGSVKASANYDIKFQSDSVGDFSENSIRKSSSDRAQSKDLSFPPSISLSSFSRTTTSLEKGPVHKSVDRSDPRVTTGSIDRYTRRLSAKHNKADADKYSNISWAQMSKDSKSSMRNEVVKETLRKFAGIYSDKSKVKNLGIEKFVLVNVLQINLNQNENHNLKYLHLLQNWYCFSQRYGLQPVTYIVPSYDKSFEEQVQDFHSLGIQGNFLTYPNSLFWDLVSQKTTSVVGGPQRVSYAGTLPTFKHFGALVMVVPLLEVLELGYNPIYLDLDIAFVRDPIPHMIRGTADFVVSIEMRTCILPSVVEVAVHTNWLKAEPNTGTKSIHYLML